MDLRRTTLTLFGASFLFASAGFLHHRYQTPVVHADSTSDAQWAYPQEEPALQALVASSNQQAIRSHAWSILAKYTNNGTNQDPEWETAGWSGKCAVGLGNSACTPESHTDHSLLLISKPAQTFSRNGQQHPPVTGKPFEVSSVLYNDSAAAFIKAQKLDQLQTWQALIKKPDTQALQDSMKFPKDAVIIKEMWESVPLCTPGDPDIGGCPILIPVFDPNPRYKTNGTDVSNWTKTMVAIDPDTTKQCDFKAKYNYFSEGAQPPPSQWIPISCFHYRAITSKNAVVPDGNGQIVNTQGTVIDGFIVLVGFHLITAEMDNWTWNTFWWTKPDVDTGLRNDHPASFMSSQPWGLYSMNTMLDPNSPRFSDGGPPEVQNPYLEGAQKNGSVSNCMNCHSQATYRLDKSKNNVDPALAAILVPRATLLHPPLTSEAPPHSSCITNANHQQECGYPSTRTHFLWSLAIKQDPFASERTPNILTVHDTPHHNGH